MKKIRLAVLCGGKSAERRVSLVSTKTVLDNLDAKKYDVTLLFIAPDGRWLKADPSRLKARVATEEPDLATGATPAAAPTAAKFDAVFPVLHGPLGEDGAMQGLLELEGLAYVGCGVLGSAVSMDKEYTKLVAERANLPVLPWDVARTVEDARAAAKRFGFPVFIKPARMGSSVGVSKVKSAAEVAPAVADALSYDDKAIVEKGVVAREVECAVLGDPWAAAGDPLAARASVCGEIAPNAEWYTYESKYIDPNGAKLMIPAPISKALERRVRELSVAAFRALDGYGMGRVDFLLDKKTEKLYFNEINTIPGFTSGSMYPLMWKAAGVPTPKLLDTLIELALRRQRARAALKSAP